MKRPGSTLRDKVCGILKLSHNKVEIEYPIAGTTADIFFVDDRNQNFPIRIAVECKDWKSPLNSANISEINILYRSAINNNEIDYVWIISNHEIGQSPSDTVKKLGQIVYSTYEGFVSSVMNFSLLLQDNISAFKNHESSENFIRPKANKNNVDLEGYTIDWINGSKRALVVYGGYGIGKTSFSHYISAILSGRYLEGEFDRIPIRVSLGGLYSKQDLKALICSTLTGSELGPSVGNFSYNLFLRMVQEGLFLIILDGFDEMRHAMEADDFAFTFEQMGPLFVGKSKTIILGRPDSFFTDEEEELILDALVREVDASPQDFDKIELSLLNQAQIDQYLGNYINRIGKSEDDLANLNAIKDRVVRDDANILSRPIQLKMFTKLIRKYLESNVTLTRYQLYFDFIYGFLRREQGKSARKLAEQSGRLGFDDPRSIFMQNVAWWVLVVKRENKFHPQEMPIHFVPVALRTSKSSEASLREALIGSVIERTTGDGAISVKGASYFYFPHKSYLEFLVAEYFCRAQFDKEMYIDFFRNMNKEIISFIADGPDVAVGNIRSGLAFARGAISREMCSIAGRDPKIGEELKKIKGWNIEQSNIYVYYEYLIAREKNLQSIEDFIFNVFSNVGNFSRFSAVCQIAYNFIANNGVRRLFERMVVFAMESIGRIKLSEIYRPGNTVSLYNADITAARIMFITRCVQFKQSSVELSVAALGEFARDASRGSYVVTGYESDQARGLRYEVRDSVERVVSGEIKHALSDILGHQANVLLYGDIERMFNS